MSVINKMLKDLETRQNRIDSEMVPLVESSKRRNRGAKPLYLVLFLGLWAAGGAYWWQGQKSEEGLGQQPQTKAIKSDLLVGSAEGAVITPVLESGPRDVTTSQSDTTQQVQVATAVSAAPNVGEADLSPQTTRTMEITSSSTTESSAKQTKQAQVSIQDQSGSTAPASKLTQPKNSSSKTDSIPVATDPRPQATNTVAMTSPSISKTPANQTQVVQASVQEQSGSTSKTTIDVPAGGVTQPKDSSTKTKPMPVATDAKPQATNAVAVASSSSKSKAPAKQTQVAQANVQEQRASTTGQLEITALDLSPSQSADLHTRRAEAAKQKNDLDTARRQYAKALSFDPARHLVREQLAALHYGAAQNTQAINLLQEGVDRYPNEAGLRLMLARIYTQNKDTARAYQLLRAQQPDVAANVDYYAMLAGLAQRAKDYQQSRTSYQQLITVDPLRSRWWMGLGIAEDQLANYPQAIADYKRAVELGKLSSSSLAYLESRIKQLEQ